MRNLFLIFISALAFSFTSCAQTIGVIEKSNYKITCDIDAIKKDWEIVLNNQKTPANLVSFEIIADKIDSSNETYYFLLAKNKENSIKIGRKLQLLNNEFSFIPYNSKLPSPSSDTVTCSGCPNGCDIKLKDDGNWMCTACIEGSGCTKTVTTPMPILINH